jgi:hypothetical protein
MMSTRHTPRRHWALGPVLLLACALLWAQALGLAHRIVHGPQLGGLHALAQPAVAAPDATAVVADGFLAQLFAGHQADSDCRVFEQLSHADTLPVLPLLALPALAPLPPLAVVAASLLIRLVLPFQARGPPTVR